MRTLVWFRGKDLRLHDHLPLQDAASRGEVVPLFVLDDYFFLPERAVELPHRMQYLLESLSALRHGLRALGSDLLMVRGRSIDRVPELAARLRVDRVVAQRWTEPFARKRDGIVQARLEVPLILHEGELLRHPDRVRSKSDEPYAVFTAFARAHQALGPLEPALAAPRKLPALPAEARALLGGELPTLAELGITHNPGLLDGGEPAARQRLHDFLHERGARYPEARDQLAQPGTSRLSQDLKFGTLSAREAWQSALEQLRGEPQRIFLNELLWREFNHMLLWTRPSLEREPFRADFRDFPWQDDARALEAWQTGRTGYPVVDAAARQLLAEGFVHNRARMIAASFLTKHLLIHPRHGDAHYMRFLTDGDWANNLCNWQWSAGCGADAQPYFRVFNPILQGQKFDADGGYVRRWLPELGALPDRHVHAPWLAPPEVLRGARLSLGRDYPAPIVDHAKARARFLSTAKQHLGKASRAG